MAKLFRLGLIALMSVAVIGCSKTDSEKAEDIKNEHAALKQELTSMGTPTTDWSVEKLNDYIAKLDRLGSLEAQASSNDHLRLYGSSSSAISHNKGIAQRALAQKRRIASDEAKQQEFQRLTNEFRRIGEEISQEYEAGTNYLEFSDDKLNDLVARFDKSIEISRQMRDLADEMDRSATDKAQFKQVMNQYIENNESLRSDLQEELNKRAAALNVEEDAS